MSGKRVLTLYAAILFSFAVILCRLYFLAQNQTYAARAKAQSAVRLALPARRGNFTIIPVHCSPGWKRNIWPSASRVKTAIPACMPIPMRTERHFCTRIGIVPCHFC